jgi:Holliday junction resolvasome RuvABC endonuclease subunit
MYGILGLDLSLTATGVADPEGRTFTIKTKTKDGDARLIHIADTIETLIEEYPGQVVAVIEDLPTHGAYSVKPLGMVHGVVRATLIRRGVPYALMQPPVLKGFATGKGNATKTLMAESALARAGRAFADDNQCDAWWLREAGRSRAGIQTLRAFHGKLNSAVWPVVPGFWDAPGGTG